MEREDKMNGGETRRAKEKQGETKEAKGKIKK